MRRPPAVLLAGLLVGLVGLVGSVGLVGCSSDAQPQPAPTPARTTGSPTSAPTRYDEYVALGDSYTAAPLVPPTDLSTTCLRSRVNYPSLVARDMPGTRLTDVSCSGATTADTVRRQVGRTGSVPPQFDALRRTTDLVTIGLGGNDSGLFVTLLGRCTRLGADDPSGSPCADLAEADGGTAAALFTRIRHHLARVVAGVRKRSPHARVLLVGYPQLVPASGTCDLLPLAAGDYPFAREANHRLTEAVRLGARDAHAGYVDLWGPSAGHDICSADPWINGRITSADRALAYHPLAVEQRAVADLLLRRLR